MEWEAVAIAVFGAGGLVQLIGAVRDWVQGRAQRQEESDERYVLRLEKEINHIRAELRESNEYIVHLVNALIEAGIKVPARKDYDKEKK
jgi:molybdopterin synthase catalytic subunit